MKSLRPARKPWKPPPDKIFKTNFDGALFESEGSAGVGVIIRDSRGEVLASTSEKIALPSSMTALEMLVARRAVLFAKEIGIHNSIFEGNSEVVIRLFRFAISITYNSFSITYNSKMMGLMTEKSVWIFITLFPVFVSITQFSDF